VDTTVELNFSLDNSTYPTNKAPDVLKAGDRGIFLASGSIYISNVILAPEFSFSMWIRPQYLGCLMTVRKEFWPATAWINSFIVTLEYENLKEDLKLIGAVVTSETRVVRTEGYLNTLTADFDPTSGKFD
jgi:hypothetical protein